MSGRLAGKVAIVTGAGRGIGAATARRLAAEGASVVAADLDLDGVTAVAKQIGDAVVPRQADVADEAAVAALVETAVERFGRLDILHNNAVRSSAEDTDTVRTPDWMWRATFDVVVMAAVYGCRHAIPVMTKTGGGSIINTSSGAAHAATATRVAYGTAKAALETLSMYTATNFGQAGIRSNVVAPGFVLTEGIREIFDDEMIGRFGAASAAGRVCQPEDVADVVAFLASDDSRYVSGQVLTVNGGGARGASW
ncbi:SDR family oxidoreductase [Frankia sp. CNm7]|uniref:SDR family oxidoreductase n=1 Tax=Frankia nepalensis TaxID=1836974 RepID=A0A937RHE7_9ACTN|nr:SDR family oxidoreductase [Frankia nepalensis]MBL7496675.1 SDR family oxidoreductase [Frankia nepalensis]MBL7510683.1 SDR family oxidoreductase [Frankia nepalensis]MBL7516684.1 SDR family oxidoreductase [Frankia nepalensis]MBL7627414.1 SDR family oxidoreductase [Frankia nepalensis]